MLVVLKRPLPGRACGTKNGNNWATAEGRLLASASPSANVATWWKAERLLSPRLPLDPVQSAATQEAVACY
jgi:hypothetical protein